jgi:mannose-6-phosphate isomerase-like protein (cupin superfamily)
MYIEHIPSLVKKPLVEDHGEDCLYQSWWEDDETIDAKKPESMKSFVHFSRITLKPGADNKTHDHDDIEQFYLVMEGTGKVWVGDEEREVSAGDTIFLPAKVPHGFENTTDKPTILLMIGAQI